MLSKCAWTVTKILGEKRAIVYIHVKENPRKKHSAEFLMGYRLRTA
jgi:hypothetical protein